MARGRLLRVLLLASSATTERRVRAALSSSKGSQFSIQAVPTMDVASQRLERETPDVLLVDLSGAGGGAVEELRRVGRKSKEIPIVAIVGEGGDRLLRALLDEGVQDCLEVGAMRPEELQKALLFAVDRRVPDSFQRRKMHEFKTGEARFWQLLAGYAEGMVLLSKDGRVRLVNPEASRLLGKAPSELIGQPFPFPSETDGGRVVEIVRPGGGSSVVEIRTVETEWEWDTSFVATVRDISEQVRAAELLSRSEERFRLATRATSDVVYEWNMVTNEVSWSEPFAWVFGYPPSEVAPNADWWFERVHEEDRPRVAAFLEELVRGSREAFELEYRFRRRDGTFAQVLDRGQVVHDGTKGPTRVIGSVADITARKASEAALRHREGLLAEAQELAQLGSWEWDVASGQFTWTDELYRIYRVDPSTFTPTYERIIAFTHPDDVARTEAVIESARERGGPFQFAYRIRLPGGDLRVLYARGAVQKDAEGRPVRLAGAVMDITETFEAEERLRQSEERLAEATRLAELGHWVWDIGANRVSWSSEMLQLYGIAAEEFTPTLEGFIARVYPADRALVRQVIEDGYAERRPFEFEYRVVRGDGEVRRQFARGDVMVGERGDPMRVLGIALDITDRWPEGPEAACSAPAREFVPAPRPTMQVRSQGRRV